MAISKNNTGVAAFVPHRWLMLTAAGAATVGLACGFAKPALAEWWKLSKADRSPAVSKPAPVENGFAGTIRKLTAESRRAAEQGDYAKAEQLAARAAKISEAAAQVVGPQGECSPQETARYLAETRARRNGTNVVTQVSSPPILAPTPPPQNPVATAPRQSLVPSQSRTTLATRSRQPQAEPVTQSAPSSRTPSKGQPPSPAVASLTEPTSGARVGKPATPAPQGNSRPQTSRATSASPSSAQSTSTIDDLLAESRLEAAQGRVDRAIALADQAIAASPSASLFGASARTASSTEAARWREHLVAQRRATAEIAAVPVKQASTDATLQSPSNWDDNTVDKAQEQLPEAGFSQLASIASSAKDATADDSLWKEELPPAPAPQPKQGHEEIRFRRSEISRQGEWVDATSVESPAADNLRPANDVTPDEPTEPAIEESPVVQEPVESLPEIPVAEATPTAIADESTAEEPAAEPDAPAADSFVTDDQPMILPKEEPAVERPPLKLRGGIQQVAGEFPIEATPVKKPIADPPAKPQVSPFEFPAEANSETNHKAEKDIPVRAIPDDVIAKMADESAPPDFPVQRFPVQRVLQLRERLQTASTFNPGASKFDAAKAKPTPAKNVPEPATSKAAEWEGDSQDTPVSEPPRRETSSATRPSLKLRERLPAVSSEAEEPAETRSTAVAKRAPEARPAAVGRSELTLWKSASEKPVAKEQPATESGKLAVSQAAYETPIVPPDANPISPDNIAAESTKAEQANIAPPPPEWYDDGLLRKRAASSEVTRKKSLNMIDQLADALKVPASTIVSLIGAGGFVLFGVGLVAVRSALKKRHEA